MPTAPQKAAQTDRHPIFAVAEANWSANKSDCSGFVRAVASRVGVPSGGLANHLVDVWNADPSWMRPGHDAGRAAELSFRGYLVVAGKKEADHGHIVIVVPGRDSHGDAMDYRGPLGGVGARNKRLNFAWKRADLATVNYSARPVPALGPKP